MTSYIALLRGVNVGGKQKVPMADLRTTFVELGFTEVRTLLNSGNVVFRTDRETTPAALEASLEAELARRLGLRTDLHVHTAAEWRALIAANSLPELAATRPGHLIVSCLKAAPGAEAVAALRAAHPGPEGVHVDGRQLYIDYSAHGIGESKLTSALLDAKLGTRGTGRNWNTVLKLAALAGA